MFSKNYNGSVYSCKLRFHSLLACLYPKILHYKKAIFRIHLQQLHYFSHNWKLLLHLKPNEWEKYFEVYRRTSEWKIIRNCHHLLLIFAASLCYIWKINLLLPLQFGHFSNIHWSVQEFWHCFMYIFFEIYWLSH